MFGWERWYVSQEKWRDKLPHTFQISMDYSVVMEICKTAGDSNQLGSNEHRSWMSIHGADQFQSIDFRVFPHILQYISTFHPLKHHAKLKQFRCYAFNGQDVRVVNPFRNYDFLEVFLDGISVLSSCPSSCLVYVPR